MVHTTLGSRMLVYVSVVQESLQGLADSPAELHRHRTDGNTHRCAPLHRHSQTLTPQNTLESTQEAAVM